MARYRDLPVVAHSDLPNAAPFVCRSSDPLEFVSQNMLLLDDLQVDLRVPAFNYDFPRTGFVDLRVAECQVGLLGNHMLRHWARYRTLDPLFSFARKSIPSTRPVVRDVLTAFGPGTDFDEVYRKGGAILMYGAPLCSLTLIHYVELVGGGPLYRYDKDFCGVVVDWDGTAHAITYRFHVRPAGRHLDYDWPRLRRHLVKAGALTYVDESNPELAFVLSVTDLVDAWRAAIDRDPLFLLDDESRQWVEPELQRLGRRFELGDFE